MIPAGVMASRTVLRSAGSRSVRAIRPAAGCAALVAAAVVGSRVVIDHPRMALAAPAVLVAAIVCGRRPAAAVVGLLVLTAGFGTLAAYTPLPAARTPSALLSATSTSSPGPRRSCPSASSAAHPAAALPANGQMTLTVGRSPARTRSTIRWTGLSGRQFQR